MKNEFYGILNIDYPNLTDDEHRQIQLGELTVLPDGKTVPEYTADVEALKELNLEAASDERERFLLSLTEQNQTQTQENEETADVRVEPPDLFFPPEITDEHDPD